MNIEIANRLVQLRKSNNLSQEALAAKLGISRQAISKWERAEASPDTDNLILLARLYGVSLDELLQTEDEIPMPEAEYIEEETCTYGQGDKSEFVHIGLNGIHVKDKERSSDHAFPFSIIIVIVYLLIGCAWNAWHPGWLIFFLIPIWHSLVEAIEKRNAHYFAYPVLVVLAYLCMGLFWFMWHPGWVIFLTIPLYYSLVSYFQALTARNRANRKEDKMEKEDGIYGE